MTEVPKKKITRTGLMNAFRLFRYIKPFRYEYALGMFFLLGASLANLTFPKLLGELVNVGDQPDAIKQIGQIALILAGLLIVQAIFSFFRTVLFVNVTEKALALLRQNTYNHLIKLPLHFFEKRRVGELNSRISADIALLQDTMTTSLADFIRQSIIIIGGIALLMYTSLKLTLFMLAFLPAIVLLVFLFGRFIRKYSKEVQGEVADSNTIVEETLQGIRSVKTFTNEFFEIVRYQKRTNEIAAKGMKVGRFRGVFSSFVILGLFGAMVLVIWRGAILLSEGKLMAGDLFSFVLYSGFIGGNIGGMASVITHMQKFIGATEDLFEIFDVQPEEISERKPLKPEEILAGRICFENVSFSYPSRSAEEVLTNLNLIIKKNQQIALVGPSGAGKSTLATLLLRLHEPTNGIIYYDDKKGNDIPLTVLRRQIALVPQDIFLFGGSIKENILYGRPNASAEEVKEAAIKANAWEFIERFPEKMETIVGERGTQLSGGQRQRIAIARALLKDPKILILDEATSSLDSESERLVQSALDVLLKGRTSIVIAHRLSTIRNSDYIVVLDKGRIVERGTHTELIALNGGLYRNLSELQFTG